MAIDIGDAYEILHRAILQLGPKRDVSGSVVCVGEAAIEDARSALERIQAKLLRQIDLLDPEAAGPYLPSSPDVQNVEILFVPMTPEHLEAIKLIGKGEGDDQPEITAARIIRTWMHDNGLD